ncbi:cytochrome P450 [Bradyrhizobium sp. CW7]|uniref:cytochrome P450 n=1 Tax=Bradyrhizobium sp. CW7 TaxID=2782688 RepID=UPI001FFB96BC|nr:cytochrome P450 [Bradyrhizobium sp. CW7]MCK1356261.1 cytochrome P450 [Bradyrhizobium sp. CW7]
MSVGLPVGSEGIDSIPVFDEDIYSDDMLYDPYPLSAQLREAGPVVRSTKYGFMFVGRYDDVVDGLQDHDRFISSRGTGISDFLTDPPWRKPSMLLETDPPVHTRARAVVMRILSPPALKKMTDRIGDDAEARVKEQVARGTCDVIADLVEPYITQVFSDTIGLSHEGRENLLKYGEIAFNGFGPRNERFWNALKEGPDSVAWVEAACKRRALLPGGVGAQIYEATDAGHLTEPEAELLIRSFLTAGLDTTIASIGTAICEMAKNPDQWGLVAADPSLCKKLFDETIRFDTPAQGLYRTTAVEAKVAGVTLDAGTKVLFSLRSANRDPRRWERPDEFDLTRITTRQISFGKGIHTCVGMMVARLEAELIFQALAKSVKRFELVSDPIRKLNNTVRSYSRVPIRFVV